MENRTMTLYPDGKKGVNISAQKYTLIREFILETLQENKEISYQKLNDLAVTTFQDNFDGSIPWYLVSVKLDLEARKIIERISGTSPHLVRLNSNLK